MKTRTNLHADTTTAVTNRPRRPTNLETNTPSESSPAAPAGRLWHCQRCGFTSPWWKMAEQFPLCTSCEREEKQSRAALLRSTAARGREKR